MLVLATGPLNVSLHQMASIIYFHLQSMSRLSRLDVHIRIRQPASESPSRSSTGDVGTQSFPSKHPQTLKHKSSILLLNGKRLNSHIDHEATCIIYNSACMSSSSSSSSTASASLSAASSTSSSSSSASSSSLASSASFAAALAAASSCSQPRDLLQSSAAIDHPQQL